MLIKQQQTTDNTFLIEVSNKTYTKYKNGEIIPIQLISNSKITDGTYFAHENTCNGRCELGTPNIHCIYDGVYKENICSKYTIIEKST